MILVGINIGKNSHFFIVIRKGDGQVLSDPRLFDNTSKGLKILTDHLSLTKKHSDRHGRYRALSLCLTQISSLEKLYSCPDQPITTDLTRKASGSISKTDRSNTMTICDVHSSNSLKKPYSISKFSFFDLYE